MQLCYSVKGISRTSCILYTLSRHSSESQPEVWQRLLSKQYLSSSSDLVCCNYWFWYLHKIPVACKKTKCRGTRECGDYTVLLDILGITLQGRQRPPDCLGYFLSYH